jgi:ABC-2 type transport system permease protein
MREFWILTKLQVSSLFGINKILHMKNKEEKKQGKRALGTLIAMVVALGYISVLYSIVMAGAYAALDMLPTLLGIMALASSLLILMFSIFETKGVLFGFGDYDIVMSWPVDIRAVAASRVVSMYAYNLIYGLLLLLPAGVIYAIHAAPPLWYYPLFLLLIFFVPALPTIVGALLGTLLTVATAHMKKSNLMSIIAQMVLVFGLMAFSMRTSTSITDPQKIMDSAGIMQTMISSVYPPAVWFQNALSTGSLLDAVWLLLLTTVSITLLMLWLGRNFVVINSRIKSKPRGETFVMQRQVHSTKDSALFKRELKRYFSSSLYVINTAIGYVMMIAAGIALLIKADEVLKIMDMPDVPSIKGVIPFVLGWMVSMGTTTASAISMEGKSLWIIKSLPVSARDWFAAKLKVTLVFSIPSILISSTLAAIGLKMGLLDTLWVYLLPLAYTFAFGVFGLWLNIRMPRLDWQSEAEAIKQGGATMVSVFGGMALGFAPVIVGGLTGSALIAPITFVFLVVMTILMWNSLVRSGEKRMLMLH